MCAGMTGFGRHEVVTPKASAGALDVPARVATGQGIAAAWTQGGQPPPASMLTHLQLPVFEEYIPPKLLGK